MSLAPARTASSDDSYEPDPRRWRALAVCLVAGFMTLLDVSIVNVGSIFYSAVSSSRGDWALAFRHGLWVISAFVLAALVLGVLDLLAGRRQDPA